MTNRAKQVRAEAGLSQIAAAVLAGVSPNTWRVYEASRESVSPAKRAACDGAVEKMIEQTARARAAA
jgi:hypothetical protein